jgi:hypothetical protein
MAGTFFLLEDFFAFSIVSARSVASHPPLVLAYFQA